MSENAVLMKALNVYICHKVLIWPNRTRPEKSKEVFMKKHLLPIALMAIALSSCGGGNSQDASGGDENINSEKTQLYVKSYQGGFGSKWLYEAKAKYEALHANDVYEEGKKGVQIVITEQKEYPASGDVINGYHQVYFFESLNYMNMVKDGAFADITKYVTGENPYDKGKTIESKMFDQDKNYYGIPSDDGSAHYYAIPHYTASMGIVYNKKVFDEKGYYFIDGYESKTGDAKFILDDSDTKSAGPDGVKGTADDGLPVTYQDYYDLCKYIRANGNVPFTHLGKNSYNYLTELAAVTGAQAEGGTMNSVSYTMDGKIQAVKLNEGLTDVLYDDNGLPQTEEVTVHPEAVDGKYDGYEVQRSIGKYYGMDFLHTLISNSDVSKSDSWLYVVASGESYSHTDAQKNFINSTFNRLPGKAGRDKNVNIAMLIDGNWWENEAADTINGLTEGERSQLDFGWMPLPRPSYSTPYSPVTVASFESSCFMKKGLSENIAALAGDFIQYMTADEQLVSFSKSTNSMKSFKYDLDDESFASLSKFGQSFWNYAHNSTINIPTSRNEQFRKTLGNYIISRRYFTSNTMTWPSSQFKAKSEETAGTYLAKMYKYYRDTVWETL